MVLHDNFVMVNNVVHTSDFLIGSLNVRGINTYKKRLPIFNWAREKKFDIIYLQECYCSIADESQWTRDWGGRIIFSHAVSIVEEQ